ncbi:MAG: hypothetical protein OSA23_00360 [Rhodospirillales bacterium]|nr:hypothetical protein [Rhodospirillales bacterium]
MSFSKSSTSKPEPETAPVIKKRKCLMCTKDFTSQHLGERVCTNCKSTSAWRESGYYAA